MHFISPAASATAAPMMAPMALSATVKAIFAPVLEKKICARKRQLLMMKADIFIRKVKWIAFLHKIVPKKPYGTKILEHNFAKMNNFMPFRTTDKTKCTLFNLQNI